MTMVITGVAKSADIEKIMENTGTKISGTKKLKARTSLELILPGLLDIGVKPEIILGDKIQSLGDSSEIFEETPERSVPNPVINYPILQRELMAKYSVSELKKQGEEVREFKPYIPGFIKESLGKRVILGSERGNAYHKIMELVNFSESENILSLLENSVKLGYLTDIERNSIVPSHIEEFFSSDLGKRMVKASLSGKLFREQFFVMKRPSYELFFDLDFSEEEKEDSTLVQGIIDAFFYEDDGVVLMDYKTDGLSGNISNDFCDILVQRYKKQLELYKMALENAVKLKVKEVFIYSFALGREIKVEL